MGELLPLLSLIGVTSQSRELEIRYEAIGNGPDATRAALDSLNDIFVAVTTRGAFSSIISAPGLCSFSDFRTKC